MRKRYNTLNEEMNRMKSLFGESRLYGNIVDNKEEIITEQFKFFDNIADIFRLTGKKLDNVSLTKFLNREIKTIDDIIKHIDEFKSLWKNIAPTKNWDKISATMKFVEKNLDKIEGMTNEDYLDYFKKVVAATPEEGGMRGMVINLLTTKRYGGTNQLPTPSIKKEIAVTNKGELVVGTDVNGVIVYKNNAGDIIPAEQIKQISDAEEVKYFDVDGNEIDVNDVNYKDGETKLYDAFGNEINKNGEIVGVDSEGTIVYNKNNEEVGVVDRDGNIIDSEGNIVDSEGKIITKKSDRIQDTTFEEVSEEEIGDVLQEKVNSSESGGIVVDETIVPPELSKQYSENQQLLEELRASRKSADEIEQKRLDLEIKKQETEQLRLKKEIAELEGGKTKITTDEDGMEKMKEKTEDELQKELGVNKFSLWWRRNISERLEKIYLLKVKEGDSKTVKNAKFFGSAMVDPFGIFYQVPKDLSKTQMPELAMRLIRLVKGNAVNILTWNVVMHQIFNNKDFAMSNIFGTKFEYYKNYSPLGFFLKIYTKKEYETFCEELKDKTGFCCEKSDGCPDFVGKFIESIPDRMKSKYGNLDCEELKKLMPDGQHLDDKEKKKFIKEESKKWNQEILGKLDLGFMENVMEWYGLINDKMFEVGIDAVDNIKMDDGETSVVDGYFQELTATKCAEDLKPKPFDEDYDEVIVVEGGGINY